MKDPDYDLETAEILYKNKRYNYAVFSARQPVEKVCKAAYLTIQKKEVPQEQNLVTLAHSCFPSIPIDLLEDIISLNPHYYNQVCKCIPRNTF